MTPLNTLKVRGLDSEASRCISSISGNYKPTNQSFSEQSLVKKSEENNKSEILIKKKKIISSLPKLNNEFVKGDKPKTEEK